MKIDFAIHSSNSNPFYLDFWPLVSRIWKVKFNIEPILLYIDNNHNIPIDQTFGTVIKFKPIDSVPIELQCLWVRYWYPSQLSENICILSDIDMFPISENYFINQIKDISESKYVHLNPQSNYFPSCYHVAQGKLYKDIFNLHDNWSESLLFLYNLNLGQNHSYQHGKSTNTWGADEVYATKCIMEYKNQNIFSFLPRAYSRIDRSHWSWDKIHLINDKYADSHSIRPYNNESNKVNIDYLIHSIMQL